MAPQKRKKDELSTNPDTVKPNARNKKIKEAGGWELEIDLAKKVDQGAINYAWKVLRLTEGYKSATKREQKEMEAAAKAKSKTKR